MSAAKECVTREREWNRENTALQDVNLHVLFSRATAKCWIGFVAVVAVDGRDGCSHDAFMTLRDRRRPGGAWLEPMWLVSTSAVTDTVQYNIKDGNCLVLVGTYLQAGMCLDPCHRSWLMETY